MTTPYSSFPGSNPTQGTSGVPTATSTPASFASVLSATQFDPTQSPNTTSSQPSTPAGRGKSRASATSAKRGRKSRGTAVPGTLSPRPFVPSPIAPAPPVAGTSSSIAGSAPQGASPQQYQRVHWTVPTGTESGTSVAGSTTTPIEPIVSSVPAAPVIDPALVGVAVTSSVPGTPRIDGGTGFNVPGRGLSQPPPPPLPVVTHPSLPTTTVTRSGPGGVEEDVEGDDEMLPAMADDDYSAQLSWQSQSKDNLKVLMDNFSPAQYDRFEAYRRHALPKQAVRKVIQQTLGHQVSQPVAQIIAGFSKVFVGEMVEKARAVQTRRGEHGPLSPDHLREAYRAYQAETGRVGAARPLRSKKLFVR